MLRIQREPGSNCKIPDYILRDGVNSVALRAFMLGWDTLEKSKYVAICCSCRTQSIWHACPCIVRRDLPQTHPEVYNEFINGNFTVQLKQGKADGVWSDLASEQIYHKEGRTTFLRGVAQKNAARKSAPRR